MVDDGRDGQRQRGITRRRLLGMAGAAAGAAAAGSLVGRGDAAADPLPGPQDYPVAPDGSTLAATLQHGPAGTLGYRRIVRGAGEPTLLRTDLLPSGRPGGGARTPLAVFGQLTDMHIIDAQSPARVEFLDRLKDPGSPGASLVPFDASYRPQEMLTAQVAQAMVLALNGIGRGPVTGAPLGFTICTGDNADNTQHNELRWQIDLLDGGATVRPDSGDPARWQGVGGRDDYDTSYWHPDAPPLLSTADHYKTGYGFPTVPGLLDTCRQGFPAAGLDTPWYSVFGNHDGLVQGNVPALGVLDAVATGALKVTGLPLGLDPGALLAAVAAGDANALATLLTLGPARIVTADPDRRLLTRAQTVAEHFTTTGSPVGHGYTQRNRDDDTAYYAFDAPGSQDTVRCIVLDTVNPFGYADGSIDGAQLAWLEAELDAHSSRHLDPSGTVVTTSAPDRLMVIFSHHTVDTMGNTLGVDRVTGTTVRDLLLRYPNVVAWVNGHTHYNQVQPHPRPSGSAVPGGFWEINTASHVDWPQQCRVVEVVDNGDGTLSVFGTIVDHAAPADWRDSATPTPDTPLRLAALSRELGVNDPQREAETALRDGRRGTVYDRNVELLVPRPF